MTEFGSPTIRYVLAAGRSISRVRRTMSRGRARGYGRAGRNTSGRTPLLPPAYHSSMTAEDQSRRDRSDETPAFPPAHQGPAATPNKPPLPATSHSSEPPAQPPLDRAPSVPPPPPLDDQIPLPPPNPPSPPRPATAEPGNGPPGFTPDLQLGQSGPPGFSPQSSEQQIPAVSGFNKALAQGQASSAEQHDEPATAGTRLSGSGLPVTPGTIAGDLLDAKDAAEEARLYDMGESGEVGQNQQPKKRAESAGGSRRSMSLSSAGASPKSSHRLQALAFATEQTRNARNSNERASSREEEIFGGPAMPASPTATASARTKGGSDVAAGKTNPDAALIHSSGADMFAEAANDPREFSDSDDSLVLDEIRPASPILKGGNTWLGQAEEPLSTASSLSKSGASSLPATAGQPVPPSRSSAPATGSKAGNGDAKASKPQSYSWKLSAKPAPAKQVVPKDLNSTPAQSAALPQNPTGAGKSYRWQLQNAGSKARQQGTEKRAVTSEQQKAAAGPKNLTWRRTAPATAAGAQATAYQTAATQRPLQQTMYESAGLRQDAADPPWLTQPVPEESAMPPQLGAMTEAERQIACAGQINPVWQAII